MKKLQIIRGTAQIIYLALLFTTFFYNFKFFFFTISASTFIGGAFFCGWLCPFGTLQEIMTSIGKKLHIKTIKIPQRLHKYLVFSRYVLFAASLAGLIFLFSIDARITFLDLLFGEPIALVSYGALALFTVAALFIERPFCNYFCPEGARLGINSMLRIFTVRRHKDICIDCKRCDNICPMNINISKNNDVRSLQCISCLECVSACPKKGALTYQLINFKEIIPTLKAKIKTILKK